MNVNLAEKRSVITWTGVHYAEKDKREVKNETRHQICWHCSNSRPQKGLGKWLMNSWIAWTWKVKRKEGNKGRTWVYVK